MASEPPRCLLWGGDKHAGKTTAAAALVKTLQEHGFTAGGILAPSIYQQRRLTGFDIIDIQTHQRKPLAVRDQQNGDAGPYRFHREGLELGHTALGVDQNQSSDLVIVDEFGPWEIQGKGWRVDVDCLLKKSNLPILLIVRRELVGKVRELYIKYGCLTLEALNPDSINIVPKWLKEKRHRSI